VILSQLKVVLTASSSGFNRAMKKAADRTQNFRNRMSKIGGTLKKFGGQIAIAAAAVTGIGIALKKAFDIGASIAETQSKFNTVFGPEASSQVQGFLDDFANKAGLTNTEAQGLVATTGAIAQGLGFSQKASGEFATSITALAGDLSSFNNIPTAETLLAINSALTGERESLKRLGIVIKETDVQQRALADSGKTVAKALTAQEKATATLTLISERAGVAVGDLDRTQGSAANVARRLAAQFKEIRDAIATALMPAFKQILDRLASSKDRFDDLKEAITENSGIISAWASLFINLMRLAASPIITLIRLIFNMGQIAIDATKALGNLLIRNWEALAQNAADMKKNFDDMGETIVDQFTVVGETLQSIADVITGGVEPAAQKATAAMNTLATAGTAAGDVISTEVDELADKIQTIRDQLDGFAQSFAKDFLGTVTSAFQGADASLGKMLDRMMNRLIAFGVQYAIFKTLLGAFPGSDFLQTMAGSMGFGSLIPAPQSQAMGTLNMGGIIPFPRKSPHQIVGARSNVRRGGGPVVNQTINFQVSAIDSRDAAKFIQEQQGTISAVVAEAVRNSSAYRRQLTGM